MTKSSSLRQISVVQLRVQSNFPSRVQFIVWQIKPYFEQGDRSDSLNMNMQRMALCWIENDND
jgi:hypothetical protein